MVENKRKEVSSLTHDTKDVGVSAHQEMKIEKIIFLDFDGVITTQNTRFKAFDLECMKHLKLIVDKTNAFIVISSTWRRFDSLIKLKQMFEPFGLFNRVIDTTPIRNDNDWGRGKEIEEWLNFKHPFSWNINGFVILDDDTDMEPFMEHLVQTDSNIGLQEKDIEKCVKILDKPINIGNK